MNNQHAACAHLRVLLKKHYYEDGSMSDFWECDSNCGAQFMVIPNVYPDKVWKMTEITPTP